MAQKFRKLLPTEVPDGPEKIGFSGLAASISDSRIRDVFEIAGPLKALNIVRNNDNEVWGTLAYEDKSTASKALNICDGFEVDGSKIKVWTYEEEKEERPRKRDRRETKFTTSSAKQEVVIDDELKKIMARDYDNRPARELYINNIPDTYDPEELRAFLGEAMQQSGLTKYPGNPILIIRVNQRYCSLELRTIEEATQALCLTNIMFKGCSLQVGRQKAVSTNTTSKTWEDVRGSCTLGIAETTEAKYDAIAQALRPTATELSTCTTTAAKYFSSSFTNCLELCNILTHEFVEDIDVYEWVKNDIKSEAEKIGPVVEVYIPTKHDLGKAIIKFESSKDSAKFLAKTPELSYFDRLIGAVFITQEKFDFIKSRN